MKHRIESGKLTIELTDGNPSGLQICGIETYGRKILTSKSGSLFSLTSERLSDGTKITVNSADDFRTVEAKTEEERTEFICTDCEKLPLTSVKMIFTSIPEENRIEVETEVISDNDEYTILYCDYPRMWFDAKDGMKFLSPYGCGEALDADSALFGHGYCSTQEYPSYGVSFQFTTVWDEANGAGVYYGVHDSIPAVKRFSFVRNTNSPTMYVGFSGVFDHTDKPGNGKKLYGKTVWQAVDGDWYDGALIYRNWMRANSRWMPEIGENGRKDSAWLKENDAWWLVHVDGEGFENEILEAAKELGVKSAVHLYLWHQIPFDNDYPHYFPEKPFIRDGVRKLQEQGIKVIPYINGRLWDTRDRGLEDYEFSSLAKPFCTKDGSGKPFTESYSAKESNGEHTVLAVMCPSTRLWKDTMKETVGKIIDDVGFDGVYMDQIAAAKPQLCKDPTHDHPAGGGTWWNESYYELLEGVKEGHDEAKSVIATECTAEMYMKQIQAYLSWLWVKNAQVPAFPVVYSGLVTLFGRSYSGLDREATDIFAAQSLLYGDQMGWISPKNYQKMEDKQFFVKLVRTRQKFHGLFVNGIMLRPPFVKDDAPRLHSENVPHAYFKTVDYPAVQGALWESGDGRKVLFLTNSSRTDAHASVKTELPDGIYKFGGDLSDRVSIKDGKFEAEIPPLGVAWIEA